MGLDMYAFALKGEVRSEVDFDTNNVTSEVEVAYWRKHPNLHGWMEELSLPLAFLEPIAWCSITFVSAAVASYATG